ncbi:LysE family translocator [Actinomycetospora atypica]|uniref:LysE family translocator n=1 Tax=Actinomycetospora atypica TaxID=1290095 RepID=A0ABV9YJF5_9PSEU
MDPRLLAFVGAATLLILVPGPSTMFAIGRGLSVGRLRALAAVVGNALGVMLQVVGVALGLGELIERSATVFTLVKLAGAAYLVYLGVTAIRRRHAAAGKLAPDGPAPQAGVLRCVLDGVLVGSLNPKTVIFFVAFLPLFVDPTRSVAPQLVLLGAIFCTIAVALDSIWALTAGTARAWLARSPRRLAALEASGGVAMIGLGVGVAASGRAT